MVVGCIWNFLIRSVSALSGLKLLVNDGDGLSVEKKKKKKRLINWRNVTGVSPDKSRRVYALLEK